MVDKILSKISYYRILNLLLFALILFIVNRHLLDYIMLLTGMALAAQAYAKGRFIIAALLTALWVYTSFITIRDKRYTDLTGRYYTSDKHAFNKGYYELVSFFTKNDPYKMDISKLPVESWHDSEGVILCKYKDNKGLVHIVKKPSDAPGNLISFGLPGCGKTTAQAMTTAERFNAGLPGGGCGVFAISVKGDMLNFVKGKRPNIKVFTPDKEEGSCHYDPLAGVSEMDITERRTFFENMAIIINPEEPGDNAKFFYEGARDYFTGVALYMMYLQDTGKIKRVTFPMINHKILSSNVFDITIEIRDSGCEEAGEYTNSYEGNTEKNVASIWNHLCKHIRPFTTGALKNLFDGKGDCITPEYLNHGDIYIDVPQNKYDVYGPAIGIITTNFLQAFMNRDDVSSKKKLKPIIFILDEAKKLHLDFNLLSEAMSTLRSKKVSVFLLMQSIAQLSGMYGEDHAREIIDLCPYISVFNAQDPKSRSYFQELVGRRKMLKRSTSLTKTAENKNDSAGVSITTELEYIFEAADFGDLSAKDKKTGKPIQQLLVYANGKYIIGQPTPCYK